jgi:RNA ligase
MSLHLSDLFPLEDLEAALAVGNVIRRSHFTLPLSLYTYARACQYDNTWTPVTTRCRGLILDDTTSEIVALPFPKFFVTGMHGSYPFAPPLPDKPFEIFDKVDGSLCVLSHYDGKWNVSTKGSFYSEQANFAQTMIDNSDLSLLDPSLTYLAEVIYPDNRIVIDYGDRTDLVLLGAYSLETGKDISLSDIAHHWDDIGSVVRSYGLADDVSELEAIAAADRTLDDRSATGTTDEGWVIRYPCGLRAKLKLSSYLALHKMYTHTNEKTVWEVLARGQDPSVLFGSDGSNSDTENINDVVPDEFSDYVRNVVTSLRSEFSDYINAAQAEYEKFHHITERKEFASHVIKSPYKAALFKLRDGRSIEELAWKHIKPRGDTPFMRDE